ncbi:MAG: tyrosine--tRNA ligase [Candidatus Liptonbacteria bacterium RIFCSPHIGHO2_01_FULL_57_28]|uniref:Tyrosine--tRNA ligase n=1 Tax=Candidatus Liptonbacteria bacterium RIFCSPHIGHO2_01_FULL_57_28 TaxID=1798647 RepID=A0A1G2C8L7_9BACT|nr:MAG: tyrosine--tRNA ligase [Candidatus Liptonbacteria bacterium RIFCSPHIGHO2_01_FULL_57_28]
MAKQSGSKEARIQELLTRSVEQVIEKEHLEQALRSGKKLRVKLGIDPTGKKIHIGRAIVLWKLREFQDLGHKVVLIIGDYTALIGDPSDKLEKRPRLTKAQVKENLKGYLEQIGMILDLKKTEIRYNSEWLSKLNFLDTLNLTDLFTASQMIERRNFKERWQSEQEISLREFMYPLMQGYDSVAVKADVELGGTDQLFNVLAGRKVQQHYGQKPQDILVTTMLDGTDGRKMSTSWGNVINIADAPGEQYGRIMAARDGVIIQYMKLATYMPLEEIAQHELSLKEGVNPMLVKKDLAFEVVKRYHGERAALAAAQKFDKVFSKKDLTGVDIPELKVEQNFSVLSSVMASGIPGSNNEGRRLIEQGAVSIDDKPYKDPNTKVGYSGGEIIKIGKRHFFRAKI